MFRRIFKTILILNICFGVVTSTHAAVTVVSDGSSFITKAEFKSLANEASSRIEAIELHVDSQIDTLVQSFLKRNNIWHPTKQTLNNNTEEIVKPYSSSNIHRNSRGDASATVNLTNKKVCIDRMNRSGMMVISLYYSSYSTNASPEPQTYRWGYYGNMNESGNWTSDNGTELMVNFYEAKDTTTSSINNAEKKYTCLVGTTQGAKAVGSSTSGHIGYVLCLTLPHYDVLIPAYFFVTKNSALVWNVQQMYKFSLTSAVNDVCDNKNGGQDVRTWIDNPIVY